jgi:hypothetical protein
MGHCYQGMTFVSIMLLLFVSELFLLVAYVRLSESVEFLFSYSYHSQFNQKSISRALSLSLYHRQMNALISFSCTIHP